MATPTALIFFLIIFITIISSFHFSYSIKNNGILCPETEQHALLSFKLSLQDPNNSLSSWKPQVDCCMWEYVVCSNLTAHVYELHLDNTYQLNFPLNPSFLSGKLNPSLLNLTHLRYLNLGYNKFEGEIPSFIGSFPKLEYLNLSYSGFNGTIPHTIGNLSTLHTLSLQTPRLNVDSLEWLSDVSQLEYLEMSYVNLSKANNWLQVINTLPYLVTLRFRGCSLSGNLSDQFGEFKSLQILDLSANLLSGPIPIRLGNMSSLTRLELVANRFTGNLPENLGQLSNLKYLSVGDNMLEGIVSESHFVNLTKLKVFYASGNHLTLKVKPNWILPFNLSALGLGSWNLGEDGQIPRWLETQKNYIHNLDLSNTGLNFNHVPKWICKIPSYLNLSHNQLHGNIPDINGPIILDLSSNRFNGSLPKIAFNGSIYLDLSNNSFSGGMSKFLCIDMTNETYRLIFLHLGENHLSGELPDCWMRWPKLRYLNLDNNDLSGSIPTSFGHLASLRSLNLRNNNLSGEVPTSIQQCTKLQKIDLSGNNFFGNIPTWMGMSLPYLRILILRSNKFTGNISPNLCHLNFLQILDLSDNIIYGVIPTCVHNFTAMVTKTKLMMNNGLIIFNFGGIRVFLESASLVTKGKELQYDKTLYLVTCMNLSGNNLSGDIPKKLTSLVSLQSLNLSRNHLTGSIPYAIGDMKQLESIDLSRNSLSSKIPNSLGDISSLSCINLAYNNLTGSIPQSTQLMGLSASSFIGNNLCGLPLTSCNNDGETPASRDEENGGVGKSEVDWLYVFMSLGYAVGISTFFTTLILNKSLRDDYFGLLEDMWDKYASKK